MSTNINFVYPNKIKNKQAGGFVDKNRLSSPHIPNIVVDGWWALIL